MIYNNEEELEKDNSSINKKIIDFSPIKIENLDFLIEEINTNNNQINSKYNIPHSLFYDKYSKRIIYFNNKENLLLIYNRTKTSLKKKIKLFFNLKVLNASVDKKLNYLIMLVNPVAKNKFIYIYCLSKDIFLSQLKEDYTYLLNMFFVDNNFFCLIFTDQIKFYLCNLNSDTSKLIKTLDYKKVLINNYYFVKQYMIFIVQKGDYSFDMYSLRKNEIELIKTFTKLFYNRRESFRPSIKRTFFLSKSKFLREQQTEILNNHNNTDNIYKTSQYFLEYIYSSLYFILLSYEDNGIFIMKIKNINTFPKHDEENQIIKLKYEEHNYNSTIQVLDNLLLIHNFSNYITIIYDIQLQAYNRLVCYVNNVLQTFQKDSILNLRILGGNIEEICTIRNKKGQKGYIKKIYALNVDLDALFKNNENRNKIKITKTKDTFALNNDEKELDRILMITRRNKSKIFFYEVFNKMLVDKTIYHRIEKIQLLLNEFIRQIKKSNTLALNLIHNSSIVNDELLSIRTVKLSYKKENEKFYLDDKYIMLSTKNTLSEIEVFKSFRNIAVYRENNINGFNDELIYEYFFYIFYFCLKLGENGIEVIKSYYDTILLLFQQIKEEKKMIKLITYFSYMDCFPFSSKSIALYLLDNFTSAIIKLQAYKILRDLGLYNELFFYVLKNETIFFVMNLLEELMIKNTNINIKKIFLNYLKNCDKRNEIKLLIKEYIGDK